MERRTFLESLCLIAGSAAARAIPAFGAESSSVSTILGNGTAGTTDAQVNNPYGLVIGPDRRLYFCDLDNQRIRSFDLSAKRPATVAGNGQRAYAGDNGPALAASLNMPHELRFDKAGDIYIAERDNHIVRKVAVKTGRISTVAGTGTAGFAGDGGPGVKAQLRQPHSIAFDREGALLICDIGNHRIRRLRLDTGIIETYAGTGDRSETPDGAPLKGTPLNGPRTMAVAPNGDIYLALREGNAIYRIDVKSSTLHRIAGTGKSGYSGDGADAKMAMVNGPKGLSYGPDGRLWVADTENHVIRVIDLKTNVITTVLGTGERGDGPESDPRLCKLSRPHAVFAVPNALYVSDSEAHRIRLLRMGTPPRG